MQTGITTTRKATKDEQLKRLKAETTNAEGWEFRRTFESIEKAIHSQSPGIL